MSPWVVPGSSGMMTDRHVFVSRSVCVCVCVSGQVKGLAVTVTHSLWNELKLCVWDAGSPGHGLSPVPTTQRLCPPPSINRDIHTHHPSIRALNVLPGGKGVVVGDPDWQQKKIENAASLYLFIYFLVSEIDHMKDVWTLNKKTNKSNLKKTGQYVTLGLNHVTIN